MLDPIIDFSPSDQFHENRPATYTCINLAGNFNNEISKKLLEIPVSKPANDFNDIEHLAAGFLLILKISVTV